MPTTDNDNLYVAVFTDSLTKWPAAFAIKSAGADVIAQHFVKEIVPRTKKLRIISKLRM